MKDIKPPETLEEDRIDGPFGEWNGAFRVRVGSANLLIICSDGMGWDHVSVSLATRCPTWTEMCCVKAMFFGDETSVMQLHPPKSQWINNHPFCLHLWRPQEESIPLPPAITVGIKELGTVVQ